MNRFVVVFLSFACALSSTVALSFDGPERDSNDFIRLPLTPLAPRKRRAADENGLTKINVNSVRDVRYGFPVEIGTPPQTFNVMLDSGSVDLWVPWKEAKNNPDCRQMCKDAEHFFDESASSTYQKGPGDFFFGYKGGSTSGTIGLDTVSIGGLIAKNQPFGLANSSLSVEGNDGVIGFSYPAFSELDTLTWIDRLVEQGQVKQRIGCVKLRLKKEAKSEFIVGGCDVEADAWAPVLVRNNQLSGWRVNLTKIILRDRTNNTELLSIEPKFETVLDTGAGDQLAIPSQFFKPIAANMGLFKKGYHQQVDCDKWQEKNLPNIEFYFG
ncbi:pepsin A-1-like [Sitodiplosis mosellana]|uniref:pepsin A-1-like n=1 Tax=Sitodiplosis mosellana TaxID=263140 RepID=UPI002444481C|nr:pepsin A-1-like [Sitodiplosis mosellana]